MPKIAVSISIHAPRTGSDNARPRFNGRRHNFNPRSPHGERPPRTCGLSVCASFQSTLPARGATKSRAEQKRAAQISIHAPRTGSDAPSLRPRRFMEQFQSTLPARGATDVQALLRAFLCISIHAPRTGSDTDKRRLDGHEERFQSTLPARGATLRNNLA